MQSLDIEMPTDEKPITLKKLVKRHFKELEELSLTKEVCSGCDSRPKILERKMTHHPTYLTLLLRREYRIAGIRAVSKKIVEIPLTKTYKIMK